MSISVVIPARNSALHLAETVAAVQAQTQTVQTIIIVDDGSHDGTAALATRLGANVQVISQPHGGAAQARNTGAAQVETSYLAFVDSDDVWVPQKLEWQIAALTACPVPTMVFGHCVQFASPELSEAEAEHLAFTSKPMPAISVSALLMRTEHFRHVGVFDATLKTGEFIEWYARAQACGLYTCLLPQTLFHRRLHRGNHGRSHSREHYAHALKAVLDARRKQV